MATGNLDGRSKDALVQSGARWLMAMSCCASQLTDALSKSQRRLPRLHAFPAHLSANRVCSRIEINERFASMHMKGLPAWRYPLALPACAIERNLFPQDESQSLLRRTRRAPPRRRPRPRSLPARARAPAGRGMHSSCRAEGEERLGGRGGRARPAVQQRLNQRIRGSGQGQSRFTHCSASSLS